MIEHKTNLPGPTKVFLTLFLMFGVFGIAFAISLITTKKTEVPEKDEVVPTAEVRLPVSLSTSSPTQTPTPRPTSSAKVDKGCKIAGCNSELCLKDGDELATTACLYKKRYDCYQNAVCKLLEDGDCDWNIDTKLSACIADKDKEEELFCGGIQGISCPEGLTCKPDGDYPDAGGTCVKD